MTNIKSKYRKQNYSGQHLLHNKKIIEELLKQARISKNDTVLDLGAGKGAVTTYLDKKAGKVLAVENDPDYVEVLKEKGLTNTRIINQDILQFHLPKEKFAVVANIPFSITTPIMKMLMNRPANGFQRGVFIVENGAAKRFTSSVVKDGYVVLWRMYFDITYVRGISRMNFSPPPKVDGAIMQIKRKANPLIPLKDAQIFQRLADYVLKYPRASVDDALRGVFTVPQIKHVKRNLGLKTDIPVAAMSEEQWAKIHESMVLHVPRFRWPKNRKKRKRY